MSETSEPVYTAFAGDDPGYGPPGITVEDAEGREVAGKDFHWPSGEFTADSADDTLSRMGFRRTGPWEWLSPQYVAPASPAPAETTEGNSR